MSEQHHHDHRKLLRDVAFAGTGDTPVVLATAAILIEEQLHLLSLQTDATLNRLAATLEDISASLDAIDTSLTRTEGYSRRTTEAAEDLANRYPS